MNMSHFNTAISSLQDLVKQLEQLRQRQRSRKQLLTLDDHQLRDIGLTRQQALEQASLHFWQEKGAKRDKHKRRPKQPINLMTGNKPL